jgi:hypothetical protein
MPWSWMTFLGVPINVLWKDHNKLVFNQYFNLRQNWLLQIATHMQMVVERIGKHATFINSYGSSIYIKWKPPLAGTLKFNVDGAHNKRNDFSSCGESLRDGYGGLIQSFYCNLGRNNLQGVVMWSLLNFMCIIRHLYLGRVIF